MSSEAPRQQGTGSGSTYGIGAVDETQTWIEVAQRIDFITSPDYKDPSVRPLDSFDYTWILLAGVVAPLILFIWGAMKL